MFALDWFGLVGFETLFNSVDDAEYFRGQCLTWSVDDVMRGTQAEVHGKITGLQFCRQLTSKMIDILAERHATMELFMLTFKYEWHAVPYIHRKLCAGVFSAEDPAILRILWRYVMTRSKDQISRRESATLYNYIKQLRFRAEHAAAEGLHAELLLNGVGGQLYFSSPHEFL